MKKCWSSPQIFSHRIWKGTRESFGSQKHAFRYTPDRVTRVTHLHDTVISTLVAGITAASGSKSARLAIFTNPLITVDMMLGECYVKTLRASFTPWIWSGCVCKGVTSLHTRRHRRAISPRAREFLPVTRASEPSAKIQWSSEYILL